YFVVRLEFLVRAKFMENLFVYNISHHRFFFLAWHVDDSAMFYVCIACPVKNFSFHIFFIDKPVSVLRISGEKKSALPGGQKSLSMGLCFRWDFATSSENRSTYRRVISSVVCPRIL